MFVYVGSYTEPPAGSGEGISVFRFDTESGDLTLVQTVAGVANPSFMALDSHQRFLYAVNELDDGGVSAFSRDPRTGRLTFLNRQLSGGASPCYVGLDRAGRYALVANYASGTVTALPIVADGRLEPAASVVHHVGASVDLERQAGPHAHMIAPTPDGRFVLASRARRSALESLHRRARRNAVVLPGAGRRLSGGGDDAPDRGAGADGRRVGASSGGAGKRGPDVVIGRRRPLARDDGGFERPSTPTIRRAPRQVRGGLGMFVDQTAQAAQDRQG